MEGHWYLIRYRKVKEVEVKEIKCEELNEAKLVWDTLKYIRSEYVICSDRPR